VAFKLPDSVLKPHRWKSFFYKRRKKGCGEKFEKKKEGWHYLIPNREVRFVCYRVSAQIGKEKTEKWKAI